MNRLYYGDCLTIMQREMNPDSVDLIYLDPPFNSNRTYNAIYKDETGRPLPDQIEAFCDIWILDEERERVIHGIPRFMIERGIDEEVVEFWKVWVKALRNTNPKLLAYLSYMVERLVQMKIILKPMGSIYLHCDPTYSHYIKVVMDGIFGEKNYRAEIIWKRHNAHNDKLYGTIHDTIFYYSYGNKTIPKEVRLPLTDDRIGDFDGQDEHGKYESGDLKGSGQSGGESGKPWRGVDPGTRHWAPPKVGSRGEYAEYIVEHFIPNYGDIEGVHARLDALDEAGLILWPNKGNVPRLKRYLTDVGMPPQSIWDDIGKADGDEDEGYDTQKPVALLDRIIKASSKKGEIVFDPFCGCATTLIAAEKLKRQWIGVDIAIHAIKRVSTVRLKEKCGLVEGRDYQITGIPRTFEAATDLWERDPYQFQKWVVEEVQGFVTSQRSNDGGVDGRIYFPESSDSDELRAMKISVKGGKTVRIDDLRALAGIIDQEEYPMGGLITRKTLSERQKRSFFNFCLGKGDIEINSTS
ncbi:MAG: DNA methyltransferase, partial [Candidatus Poribacteria bacterium]|nr:DNA methyltransferase [Candidatus Poribacteria bacterium]